MGIGNIVGGIAQGVDRGIDTVSHVLDMWKSQDETKLRDMEMQRLQQPFDYTTLPIYNDLDEVGRAKVDKAFAGLPEKWRGTQGGAHMVMKNLAADAQMIDSFEGAARKQSEAHVMNLKSKLDAAQKTGDRRLMQEVQAELRVAIPKAMTIQQTIEQMRLNIEVQDMIASAPAGKRAEWERILKTGGKELLNKVLLEDVKARHQASQPSAKMKETRAHMTGSPAYRASWDKVNSAGFGFDPSAVGAGEDKAGGDAGLGKLDVLVQKGRAGKIGKVTRAKVGEVTGYDIDGVFVTDEEAEKIQAAIGFTQ